MSGPAEFLQGVLHDGKAVLRARPESSRAQRNQSIEILQSAFEDYRLAVAGPLIDFDGEAAFAAGELLQWACWYLLNRQEPPTELETRLNAPRLPSSPAQHLSADLVLRLLPQVARRARALAPADPLTAHLEKVLRQWPLTGVLSDVAEGPLTPLEFGQHPGLLLLYAERLASNPKPAWFPQGRAFEFAQLVFAQRGQGELAALHRPGVPGILTDYGGRADAHA
jgi:hypothetical protein